MSSSFLSKDTVYVNSKKRLNGTSSNFVVNISEQVNQSNDYDSVSLLNASIPKSYYLFNSVNNTFILSENGVASTITITEGNYTISSLLVELTTKLNSHSYTYVITFNKSTGKLGFTVSGNGIIQPIFDFTDSLGCEEVIGFENDSYQFVANGLTSVSVVNLQLTNSIQLMSNIVKNNIISSIIPNSVDFSFILYNEQNPEFSSQKLSTTSLQSAKFWLVDANTGNILDLNGLEFNFTLAFYKANRYYEKFLFDKKMSDIIDDIITENELRKNK